MQVSARVVPATAAWTGVAEAATAALEAALRPRSGVVLVRRTGVVQTQAEVLSAEDRPLLLVTVQHPRN